MKDTPILDVNILNGSNQSKKQLRIPKDKPLNLHATTQQQLLSDKQISKVQAAISYKAFSFTNQHLRYRSCPDPSAELLKLESIQDKQKKVRLSNQLMYRVDDTHANAFAEWKRLGSPGRAGVNAALLALLNTSSRLTADPLKVVGGSTVRLSMPKVGVAQVVLNLQTSEKR